MSEPDGSEWVPDGPDGAFARLAAHALNNSPYPAMLLEVPSELILAASVAASLLLDPTGEPVVGRALAQFTADRPPVGPDIIAGGRLNGLEAFRVLKRANGSDQRVRMWVRPFADEPSSRYVLVVIGADVAEQRPSRAVDLQGSPAVVGTADASLIIDRISSDADSLFGWSVGDLVGRLLTDLIAEHDAPNFLTALAEASASQQGVTLYLQVRGRGADDDDAVEIGCEVLILPLYPSPSCAFVFLPTPVELSRTPVAADLSAILVRLSRAAEVAHLVQGATSGLTERDLPGLSSLTTRELEILTRLLDGDRGPAIAADLSLTQGTVRNYLASIFSKVGVASQQQLLTLFREARANGG